MSKAEILRELPNLKPDERQEVLEKIWQMNEAELIRHGSGSTAEEKALLDAELEDYRSTPDAGMSWEAAKAKLREPIAE